jgi:hypothetical protein
MHDRAPLHLTLLALASTLAVVPRTYADPPTPLPLETTATGARDESLGTPPVPQGPGRRIWLGVTGRLGGAYDSSMPIEPGTVAPGSSTLNSRLRVRLEAASPDRPGAWSVAMALGFDLADGTLAGQPTLQGDKLPHDRFEPALLQDAWVGVQKGKRFGVRAGAMTSHWGLGLVANDGGQGHSLERNDWFTPTHSGDRVVRAAVFGMPLAGTDTVLRGLWLSAAADRVIEDDTARWRLDQKAIQVVGAARLYLSEQKWLGLYAVQRTQTEAGDRRVDAHVLDIAFDLDGRTPVRQGPRQGWRLEGEGAWIGGTTTLAPTPELPEHRIRQIGAAARMTYGIGGLLAQLDLGYFSGDADLDDGTVRTFHADRNFRQGLVLFPSVLAWQTGRARLRASDPALVGVPAQDLDRLASEGAVFDAVTVFPKLGWRFGDRGEVYLGMLLAWSPAPLVDPYASRIGGQPRNFLGVNADGRMLGAEVDAGIRWRWLLPEACRSAVQIALEYGRLTAAGALAGASPHDTLPPASTTQLTLSLLAR